MNGYYARYFDNPEYFIEDIEVLIEEELINVKFRGNEINASFALNKDNLTGLYNRLEEQYKVAIEEYAKNKKKYDIKDSALLPLSIFCLAFTSFALTNYLGTPTWSFAMSVPVCVLLPLAINKKSKTNKERHLMAIEQLYNNMQEVGEAINKCNSFSNCLSNKAKNALAKEQELKKTGLTSSAYTINWLDKCSKKDLEKLAYNLRVYKDLKEPISFNVTSKPKTKRRTMDEE